MSTPHAPSAARTARRWRATTSASSAAIDLFQHERAAEEDQHGHGYRCDQERDSSPPRVLRTHKEVHHQVADHDAVYPAHQLWGEVFAEDRNEDEDHSRDQAGADLRDHHAPD